jgi:Co/Zn/Cd efflux system component
MGLKKTVLLVASLNFGYFAVELSFSQVFNSLSLLSDSLDFLEDSAINLLIFLAFAWSALARKRLSYLLALILLIPGAVFIAEAISKFNEPIVPNGFGMSVIGLGALFVNVFCAFILTKHKSEEGGLAKAAYLSARNDAVANILIIAAGGITAVWVSQVPDLVIGIIIFAMNFDSAMQVLKSQK